VSQLVKGRPDFRTQDFGITTLKKFPPYAYCLGKGGALIHKLVRVQCRWYDVSNCGNDLVRRDEPHLTGFTSCGMMISLDGARGTYCALPDPNAVLCGRCHGTGPIWGKHGSKKISRKDAHKLLGCIAQGR
jgi:hypothetical protein